MCNICTFFKRLQYKNKWNTSLHSTFYFQSPSVVPPPPPEATILLRGFCEYFAEITYICVLMPSFKYRHMIADYPASLSSILLACELMVQKYVLFLSLTILLSMKLFMYHHRLLIDWWPINVKKKRSPSGLFLSRTCSANMTPWADRLMPCTR